MHPKSFLHTTENTVIIILASTPRTHLEIVIVHNRIAATIHSNVHAVLIILDHNTMTFQNISGIIIKENILLIKNKK
jgi:hypothetical protein